MKGLNLKGVFKAAAAGAAVGAAVSAGPVVTLPFGIVGGAITGALIKIGKNNS